MIEYVIPNNIDNRVLEKGAKLLKEGGLLAVPTDTSWSIACSFASSEGIKRLKAISGERDERHFTLLCSDISQFGEFCSIDNTRFRLIKKLTPGPYVFILKTLLGTEKALGLKRKEIGIRIPDHPIPIALIKTHGQPLYSVTAKRNMIFLGTDEDLIFEEKIEDEMLPPILEEELFEEGWEVEAIDGLSMILDPGEERPRIFSSVLDLCNDEVKLIRAGAGANQWL